MSRSLSLQYKATNPRSVRGARRRGWQVILVNGHKHMAWIGLNIWCEMYCSGHWVSSHSLLAFAFESPADATVFKLKWG